MQMINLDLYGEPFAECVTMPMNFRTNREMRDSACLTYLMQGEHDLYGPVKKIKLSSKQALLMKCGNFVGDMINITADNPLVGVVFHLNPETIRKAFGQKDLDFLYTEVRKEPTNPMVELGHNPLIEGFVASLKPFFDNPSLATEAMLAVKLQELTTILVQSGDEEVKYLLGTIQKKEIFEFEQIIKANLYNNLSIPELAHLTNKSESSFKREFKRLYDDSPAKYLKSKKLEKAAQLLERSELSISEISWDCGFEDLAHFSSSFSSVYKLSPRNYRASVSPA